MSSLNELTDCIDLYIMTLLKMHEESLNMPKNQIRTSLSEAEQTVWNKLLDSLLTSDTGIIESIDF